MSDQARDFAREVEHLTPDGQWRITVKAFEHTSGWYEAGGDAKTYKRIGPSSDDYEQQDVDRIELQVTFGGPSKHDDSHWSLETVTKTKKHHNEDEVVRRRLNSDPTGKAPDGTKFWIRGVLARAVMYVDGYDPVETVTAFDGEYNDVFDSGVART
ncbi:hypothetical protein [Kocuria nitroreducens]|uniref:hypothetical protein n=1 Tax=Kocuria nitroreducens TaxID=3058914 RepID=UPI0036DF9EBB